jgi:cyclic pyranopterin phosphate synthase
MRCLYCLPEEGVALKSHRDILTLEEVLRVARVAVSLGVTGIRLTGGEPLVRKGLVDLVVGLSALKGLEDLAITTNGTLLAPLAAPLKAAGLGRINISLDTLRPERFPRLARRHLFTEAADGIKAALAVGFDPVKLNVVLVRGLNDDEVLDFARLTRRPFAPGLGAVHVRFIELMPLGESAHQAADLRVTGQEVREWLLAAGELIPAGGPVGNGPAEYYRWVPLINEGEVLPIGGAGTIGFINPISRHFCSRCNRLRLTADGKINPCLASTLEIDLRTALRSGAEDDELAEILRTAVGRKPEEHNMGAGEDDELRRMSRLGG